MVVVAPALPIATAGVSEMGDALIHACRFEGQRRTEERNAQGERKTALVEGPWVACRFMERGVAREQRWSGGASPPAAKTTARGFELLANFVDENGDPFVLTASMRLRVISTPITDAVGVMVEIDGDPERINDGEADIGWMGTAVKVQDAR